jgi:hypothetical protein
MISRRFLGKKMKMQMQLSSDGSIERSDNIYEDIEDFIEE